VRARSRCSNRATARRPWYQSIAGNLLLAFALIAALTVSATLLSLIRFNQIDAVMNRLTGVSLPLVQSSLGVEAKTAELVVLATELSKAENEVQRFERMERLMSAGGFRGCPYVNAVTEIGDRKHAATAIAIRFKEERLEWYRALLERMGARDPAAVALQLQILVEGAIASFLVREDPGIARAARNAAAVLLDAAVAPKA